METSTYPYAPLLPRAIPVLAIETATKYGVELHASKTPGLPEAYRLELVEAAERFSRQTFALERRLLADLTQFDRGPLPAVTR